MGELAMKEEASIRNNLRVSVKLLSQRYLSTMKAIWIGVTLPLPKDSGFLDLDCLAIVVVVFGFWVWDLVLSLLWSVCCCYLFRVCEKLKRVKKEGRKCGCERRDEVYFWGLVWNLLTVLAETTKQNVAYRAELLFFLVFLTDSPLSFSIVRIILSRKWERG